MFQTRSELNGLSDFDTLDGAFMAAKNDRTIWKISFNAQNGERIRLIRLTEDSKWIYQSII